MFYFLTNANETYHNGVRIPSEFVIPPLDKTNRSNHLLMTPDDFLLPPLTVQRERAYISNTAESNFPEPNDLKAVQWSTYISILTLFILISMMF